MIRVEISHTFKINLEMQRDDKRIKISTFMCKKVTTNVIRQLF